MSLTFVSVFHSFTSLTVQYKLYAVQCSTTIPNVEKFSSWNLYSFLQLVIILKTEKGLREQSTKVTLLELKITHNTVQYRGPGYYIYIYFISFSNYLQIKKFYSNIQIFARSEIFLFFPFNFRK